MGLLRIKNSCMRCGRTLDPAHVREYTMGWNTYTYCKECAGIRDKSFKKGKGEAILGTFKGVPKSEGGFIDWKG